ncbi:MAG: hypothetical protein LUD17_14080 [Bacteroidales bacterium]|nr:hypothetical protein [Bacteroidales bacterium]
MNTSLRKFSWTRRPAEELRSAISNLQLGELIIKDQNAALLDIGKPYKKIKVNRLI